MTRLGTSSFLASVVLLSLGLIGAVSGYGMGTWLQLCQEQREIAAYVSVLMNQANRIVNSAQETLEKANRSPYEICSGKDKSYLRELLFQGYHIRDIGRFRDNRLQCSTLLNDIKTEKVSSNGEVQLDNGTYIYKDRKLITPGSHGAVLRRNGANVVLSSRAFEGFNIPGYTFTVYLNNPKKNESAQIYSSGDSFRSESGMRVSGYANERLHHKACDPTSNICISAYRSVSHYVETFQVLPVAFTIVGFLAGECVGLIWFYLRSRDRSLISLLKKALNANSLALVYQPIVNISNGRVVGFEALIRWEINKGDFVPPDYFVARAEVAGLSDRITFYVIDRMILEMGEFLRLERSARVNVNVTASDVQDPLFRAKLQNKLTASDIEPHQVGLELTERTAVDFVKAAEGIRYLRNRGHSIYIDDFGTGYSNLSYISELHVDAIKIDKIFTRTISGERQMTSIVPQIISMAQHKGLDIVVEGIETESQAEYFASLNASLFGQGWFYSKPLVAGAARELAKKC